MLHDHVALCILTFLGLIWSFYAYMVWDGKRMQKKYDERYCGPHKLDAEDKKFPIEEYEAFWEKDKKVS